MRKPQFQPALASLTEADREQLADWLRHGEYDAVLERVNEPRPEGFGLNISKKPLQTFYAKVALLDLINSRLPNDKRLTLATFESLAQGDILLLGSADKSNIAGIHDTILGTVRDLAESGDNTPAQLLALQRLADFPERAEIRAERLQLQREKEQRAKEMRAHRMAMDLRNQERADRKEVRAAEMHAHKIQRDTKWTELATEKVKLGKESFAFRQRQHEDRMGLAREKRLAANPLTAQPSPHPKSDHLGPFATNWKEVGQRVCKQFNISPEEAARRAELRKTWKQPNSDNPENLLLTDPSPRPEGTSETSPASSVPGNPATFASVPEGRLIPNTQSKMLTPHCSILNAHCNTPSASPALNPQP